MYFNGETEIIVFFTGNIVTCVTRFFQLLVTIATCASNGIVVKKKGFQKAIEN